MSRWSSIRLLNLVFLGFILLGSYCRYLRVVPGFGWATNLPYVFEVFFLLILIGFVFFKGGAIALNILDVAVVLLVASLSISFLNVVFENGLKSQVQFFAQYILPFVAYFWVRIFRQISLQNFAQLLKVFLLIALLLTSAEFALTAWFGFDPAVYYAYWDDTGVEGFHASAVNYFLLGELRRPWGVMALPQSSGVLFAALGVYFSGMLKFDKQYYYYVMLSVAGAYISGSRTAYVLLFMGWVFLYFLENKSRYKIIKLGFIFGLSLLLLSFLITMHDPEQVIHRFYISISNYISFSLFDKGFVYELSESSSGTTNTPHFLNVLFGQGVEGAGNSVAALGEIHLLNIVLRAGIVPACFGVIVLVVAVIVLAKVYRENQLAFVSIIPVVSLSLILFAGSAHYDSFSRYPASILVACSLGFLSRMINDKFIPINYQYTFGKYL